MKLKLVKMIKKIVKILELLGDRLEVCVSVETNCVDPEAVWSWSTLFVGKASKTFQQTTKAEDFCCDWLLEDPPLYMFNFMGALHLYIKSYHDKGYSAFNNPVLSLLFTLWSGSTDSSIK